MILTDTESKNNQYVAALARFHKNYAGVLQLVKQATIIDFAEKRDGFTKEEYVSYRDGIDDFINAFQTAFQEVEDKKQ